MGDQAKKLEGDMARHLAFIDRLLADKDKLSAKCVQLGKDIKVASHLNILLPLLLVFKESADIQCDTHGQCQPLR